MNTKERNLLVGVIHVVVDWVETSLAGAGITSSWASTGSGELSWGIGNLISGASARVALEGVKKSKPVTNLVGDSLSLVEVGSRSSWNSGVKDGAAVPLQGC